MSHTRLHNIWLSMRARCNRPNSSGWEKYGAKGVRVCDEWNNSFEPFRDWAFQNGYADNLTLDRIDPHGNYEPDNCRWATQIMQQNNRSNNVFLTYKGETKRLLEWSKETGISHSLLYNRYKHGWDANRIFEQPKRKAPTKAKKESKVPDFGFRVVFNDDMDMLDAICYINMIKDVDYESIEPYGKACGVIAEIKEVGKKVYIYRNETCYVFDFRRTIYDEETGQLKATYTRQYYTRISDTASERTRRGKDRTGRKVL